MRPLVLVQIIAGVVFLTVGIFGLTRPKLAEDKREDYLALTGTFSLILGFLLLALLLLK